MFVARTPPPRQQPSVPPEEKPVYARAPTPDRQRLHEGGGRAQGQRTAEEETNPQAAPLQGQGPQQEQQLAPEQHQGRDLQQRQQGGQGAHQRSVVSSTMASASGHVSSSHASSDGRAAIEASLHASGMQELIDPIPPAQDRSQDAAHSTHSSHHQSAGDAPLDAPSQVSHVSSTHVSRRSHVSSPASAPSHVSTASSVSHDSTQQEPHPSDFVSQSGRTSSAAAEENVPSLQPERRSKSPVFALAQNLGRSPFGDTSGVGRKSDPHLPSSFQDSRHRHHASSGPDFGGMPNPAQGAGADEGNYGRPPPDRGDLSHSGGNYSYPGVVHTGEGRSRHDVSALPSFFRSLTPAVGMLLRVHLDRRSSLSLFWTKYSRSMTASPPRRARAAPPDRLCHCARHLVPALIKPAQGVIRAVIAGGSQTWSMLYRFHCDSPRRDTSLLFHVCKTSFTQLSLAGNLRTTTTPSWSKMCTSRDTRLTALVVSQGRARAACLQGGKAATAHPVTLLEVLSRSYLDTFEGATSTSTNSNCKCLTNTNLCTKMVNYFMVKGFNNKVLLASNKVFPRLILIKVHESHPSILRGTQRRGVLLLPRSPPRASPTRT